MRFEVSAEAADYVRAQGGQLWIWAARPRVCCGGSPAYLYTATEPPPDLSGFSPLHAEDLDVWFRAPAGRRPDVLEIGMRGRRHPRVEAYWDRCAFVLLDSRNSLTMPRDTAFALSWIGKILPIHYAARRM